VTSFCFISSGIFEVAVRRAELSDTARADMCAEANVVRADVDRLVAEAMSRPDTLHPRVAGVAGNTSALAAIYRSEFDTAYRLLEWAAPYHEMMGPFASVYGACYDGIAARYQLDIARAEASAGRSKSAPAQGRTLTLRASPVHFSANCSTRQAIWPQPYVCLTRALGSVPRAAEWTTCRAVRDRCATSSNPR
jgi:hypothetical protein